MQRRLSIFWLALLFLCLHTGAKSQNTYIIQKALQDKEYLGVDSFVTILSDSTKQLSFSDIQQTNLQSGFEPLEVLRGNFRHDWAYWGKVKIQNKIGRDHIWQFGVWGSYTEVHVKRSDGEIEKLKLGWLRPQYELPNPESKFIIDLALNDGEEVELIYRSESITHYEVGMEPFLATQETVFEWRSRGLGYQGFFQGIIWIMILYNLISFFSSRDKSYLYYVLYLFAGSVYFLYLNGFTGKYITGNTPIAEPFIWLISTYASTFFYALFTRRYFNTKKTVPKADKLILGWVKFEVAVLVILIGILAFSLNMWLVRMINVGMMLIGTIISIVVLWKLRKLNSRIYYLFVVGASTYLLSVIVFFYGITFAQWGWLQGVSGRALSHAVEVGLVIEVLLFSVGLSHRMKKSEESKREAQQQLIEQLEANQQLQNVINRELESKVLERTTEIEAQKEEIETQKEVLERQNEDLRSLNDEKNHLMGVLAHDLRNPMTSLLTIASLLKSESEELSDEHVEYAEIMLNTLNRMNDMINRTLDIKASEANDLQINWQPVNLSCMVSRVVENFRARAMLKEIELICETVELYAELDADYTEQILENLISNAIKFSPFGKKVFVEMQNTDANVKIAIKDQGPGIDEQDMPKLFGKYQKLSAQPTAGEKSTGLGLSIVKKYVEAMNGSVSCQSKPEKGATFMVEFPTLLP